MRERAIRDGMYQWCGPLGLKGKDILSVTLTKKLRKGSVKQIKVEPTRGFKHKLKKGLERNVKEFGKGE